MNLLNERIESRSDKIKMLWKKAHGISAPYFLWVNHPFMKYEYNESTDTIDCECGMSVSIDIPTEEITQKNLVKLIEKLELQVYDYFKENYNVDLGLPLYYD